MSKPKRKTKPRDDRGGRYCMVLELEHEDHTRLDELVERYQVIVGPATKANKAFVLRQLIRNMHAGRGVPPVRG